MVENNITVQTDVFLYICLVKQGILFRFFLFSQANRKPGHSLSLRKEKRHLRCEERRETENNLLRDY